MIIMKRFLFAFCLFNAAILQAGSKVPPPTIPPPKHNVQENSQPPEASTGQSNTPPASFETKTHSAPVQEPLPSSDEMTHSYQGAFIKMLVTLLGLIFLVFATVWTLRRLGKGKFKFGSGQMIHIIERRAVSPKTMLYIVQIGNRKVLISESQLEVRSLSTYEELPDIEEK